MTINRFVILLLTVVVTLLKVGCSFNYTETQASRPQAAVTTSVCVSDKHHINISSMVRDDGRSFLIRMAAVQPTRRFMLMNDDSRDVLIDLPEMKECCIELDRPAPGEKREYTLLISDATVKRYERYSLVLTNRGLVTRLSQLYNEDATHTE